MQWTAMSDAEWNIMRVVWTLRRCSSRQVINVMQKKKGWKASTVKTLITRLKKKGCLDSRPAGNRNLYSPKIGEQQAADLAVQNVFRNICPMHAGRALDYLIKRISLSKSDVQRLIRILRIAETTAPVKVKCNCLDPDAEEEVHRNGHE